MAGEEATAAPATPTTAAPAEPTAAPVEATAPVEAAAPAEEAAPTYLAADEWDGWDGWDGSPDVLPEHVQGWYSRFDERHKTALSEYEEKYNTAAERARTWYEVANSNREDPTESPEYKELAAKLEAFENAPQQSESKVQELQQQLAAADKRFDEAQDQYNQNYYDMFESYVEGFVQDMEPEDRGGWLDNVVAFSDEHDLMPHFAAQLFMKYDDATLELAKDLFAALPVPDGATAADYKRREAAVLRTLAKAGNERKAATKKADRQQMAAADLVDNVTPDPLPGKDRTKEGSNILQLRGKAKEARLEGIVAKAAGKRYRR